jgi:CRISPR-associated protein Cmr6
METTVLVLSVGESLPPSGRAHRHLRIPIPFLSVLPHPHTEQNRTDCQTVLTWLKQALEHLGIGAKTAVGYGRFGSS